MNEAFQRTTLFEKLLEDKGVSFQELLQVKQCRYYLRKASTREADSRTDRFFLPENQDDQGETTMQREVTQPLLIMVEETMRLMRLGRAKIDALIRQEGLPVHWFGRRELVDPNEQKRFTAKRGER